MTNPLPRRSLLDRIGATGSLVCALHCALLPLVIAMTFGGTLVGLAHLANLRLNHGHVHDATCAH